MDGGIPAFPLEVDEANAGVESAAGVRRCLWTVAVCHHDLHVAVGEPIGQDSHDLIGPASERLDDVQNPQLGPARRRPWPPFHVDLCCETGRLQRPGHARARR